MKSSTNLLIIYAIVVSSMTNTISAQNTKVVDSPSGKIISNAGGTDIPHSSSILDIRSNNKGVLLPRMSSTNRDAIGTPQAGLLLYNTSTGQFNYHNGSAWQVFYLGNQWSVNGNILHHGGPVGVGTGTMTNTSTFLTVRGNLGGNNLEGMHVDASGTTGKPFYGYAVNGVSKAHQYLDGSTLTWALNINGTDRLSVTSTGDLTATGDASINGDITLKNGRGVLYNSTFSGSLKYYTFQYSLGISSLAGFATSPEFNIPINSSFTNTPKVFAGNVNSSNCTIGEPYYFQIYIYGCTTSSCKARLINTSPNTVGCNISYNFICIGN